MAAVAPIYVHRYGQDNIMCKTCARNILNCRCRLPMNLCIYGQRTCVRSVGCRYCDRATSMSQQINRRKKKWKRNTITNSQFNSCSKFKWIFSSVCGLACSIGKTKTEPVYQLELFKAFTWRCFNVRLTSNVHIFCVCVCNVDWGAVDLSCDSENWTFTVLFRIFCGIAMVAFVWQRNYFCLFPKIATFPSPMVQLN